MNFGEIRKLIAEELRLNDKKIFLAFDNDSIADHETPATLDLEDEDCIDVFGS